MAAILATAAFPEAASGGQLSYSTYLGGSGGEVADGITVDSSGCAYVTGSYRPSVSTFRFTYSPDFSGVDLVKTHGVNGDVPIRADANGDGISDIGIFRNAIARWWFLCSPNWATTCASLSFGTSGDIPIYGKPPGTP